MIRNAIHANRFARIIRNSNPFFIARQADSPESLAIPTPIFMARQVDSPESLAIPTPIFIAHQADSPESLEFPIRANRVIRANRANRFTQIAPPTKRVSTQRV